MIALSPQLAEMAPGLLALVIAAGGWALARYTRKHSHDRVTPAE